MFAPRASREGFGDLLHRFQTVRSVGDREPFDED